MTVEQAIETLKQAFAEKFPGYAEAKDRYDRAVEGSRRASAEFELAKEAMAVYARNDEYLLMSIRGCEEALGMKP